MSRTQHNPGGETAQNRTGIISGGRESRSGQEEELGGRGRDLLSILLTKCSIKINTFRYERWSQQIFPLETFCCWIYTWMQNGNEEELWCLRGEPWIITQREGVRQPRLGNVRIWSLEKTENYRLGVCVSRYECNISGRPNSPMFTVFHVPDLEKFSSRSLPTILTPYPHT